MSLIDDLAALFQTNGTLSGVPFTLATDPQSIPLPKITLLQVQGKPQYDNDGFSGVSDVWIQLQAIATQASAAKSLTDACKTVIGQTLRTIAASGAVTIGAGSKIGSIFVENERQLAEPIDAGREKGNQLSVLSLKIGVYG